MKRGGPLRRTTPLRSTPRPRTSSERAIWQAVLTRDGHRCQLAGILGAGPCYGTLTPHHRRKASQGGGYTEANLSVLCASHNDRLESDADLARLGRTLGLVLRRGDTT